MVGPYLWLSGADPAGTGSYMRTKTGWRLITGWDGKTNQVLLGPEDSPLLVVGPGGSGKSSCALFLNIAFAPGAVVVVSSRNDHYLSTSMLRARKGVVWSAFDRKARGAAEWRFSISQGCENYPYALKVAKRWLANGDVSTAIRRLRSGDDHWPLSAAPLFAAMLFAKETRCRSLEWLREISDTYTKKDYKALAGELIEADAHGLAGGREAGQAIRNAMARYAGELSGILSTITKSIQPFVDEEVLHAGRKADANFDQFVRGYPDEFSALFVPNGTGYEPLRGRYDSLYINVGDSEGLASAVIMELLHRIIEACKRYADECSEKGLPRPPPVVIALDELIRSPIMEIGTYLTDLRDRGVLLVGGLLSLEVEDIYGPITKDFLSLWRTTLVTRGIKHIQTLETLSKLAGQYWEEMRSWNANPDTRNATRWVPSVSYQRMDRLPIEMISAGHPHWKDGVMMLDSDAGISWIKATPYYRGEPMPRVLVNSAEWAMKLGTDLPLPPLARDNDYRHLDALGLTERFKKLQAQQ